MKLGEIIRRYRSEHKMSMNDFAQRSGLSKPYISMLEANKNSRTGKPIIPSVGTIQKVATAMNITFAEILTELKGEYLELPLQGTEERIKKYFPELLRRRREDLSLTQEELAQLMGYKTFTSINKIETGEKAVTWEQVKDFADALDTMPEYLLGWMPDAEDVLSDEEEKELVKKFRELTEPNKQTLKTIVDNFLDAQQLNQPGTTVKQSIKGKTNYVAGGNQYVTK